MLSIIVQNIKTKCPNNIKSEFKTNTENYYNLWTLYYYHISLSCEIFNANLKTYNWMTNNRISASRYVCSLDKVYIYTFVMF